MTKTIVAIPEKNRIVWTGVFVFGLVTWNQLGSNCSLPIEYAIRDAPKTPELLEIMTSSAPNSGTYHLRMFPTTGSCMASSATALSLLSELPKYWKAGWPWMLGIPSTRFEYANAKMRMVRISATDVRGITLEGRCVSSAACEMLSSPTNEMIASDTPNSRSLGCGQWYFMACTSICGFQASRNPHTKIKVSLTTSTPATSSLSFDDCRTPAMFSRVK